MKKKSFIIIAIIVMAVGFAALSTALYINGDVVIGSKTSDYDIVFTGAALDGVEDNSLIIDDGMKIRYETKELVNIGDSSELVYEITNNSSQYDGEVSITCAPKGTITHSNLYAIDTTNTPEIVYAKRNATGSIVITLKEESNTTIRAEFECELNVKAVERTEIAEKLDYKETLLNGTDPVISGNLIPVTIADNGAVTYANVKEEWYSYENKEWANAVILTNTAKVYKVGDTISENDIESYFVWIPKYKYQLWNVGTTTTTKKAHSIDIVFGTENSSNKVIGECTTPGYNEVKKEYNSSNVSGNSGNCNNGEYMTHPAFISLGVNGIWVGKYETGYKGANSAEEAQANNPNSSNIIIKPNVYSWRNLTVNNMFMASYNYSRELDSHMMKNTEWGAVAYLSHSKYGINNEVNINNNSAYKTGYSALLNTDQHKYPGTYGDSLDFNQSYNTEIGYLASTTGNISGVYDMSGGAWEYMASYISGNVGSSDFQNITKNEYKKYLDVYDNRSSEQTYQYRILGDATGEMGPFVKYAEEKISCNKWYGDWSYFVDSNNPWFDRSANYGDGALAGLFYFTKDLGVADSSVGFRLVLAP